MLKRLFKGAFILGLSNIICKILGLFFILYYARLVGDEGISLYTYAYVPLVFFMDISSLGLIPGTSKEISRLREQNEEGKIHYLKKHNLKILIIIGLISFIVFNLTINYYLKNFLDNSNKIHEITFRLSSLSLLITPLLSFYRGYLQGLLKINVCAISIIIEQFIRITFLLTVAYYLIKVKEISYHYVIYLSFVGIFLSSLSSLLFLMYHSLRIKYKTITKYKYTLSYFRNNISIGIITIFITIFQMIDSVTFFKYTDNPLSENYYRYFVYNTMRVILLPIIFAQSIGVASIPNLSINRELSSEISRIIKVGLIILMPLVFCFYFFSEEIYYLFYGNNLGHLVLKRSSILILIYGLFKIQIGILLGINKIKPIIIFIVIGYLLKYILNIILIKKFFYMGMIISSGLIIIVSIVLSYLLLIYNHKLKIKDTLIDLLMIFTISFVSILMVLSLSNIIGSNTLNYYNILIKGAFYVLIYFLYYSIFLYIIKINIKFHQKYDIL